MRYSMNVFLFFVLFVNSIFGYIAPTPPNPIERNLQENQVTDSPSVADFLETPQPQVTDMATEPVPLESLTTTPFDTPLPTEVPTAEETGPTITPPPFDETPTETPTDQPVITPTVEPSITPTVTSTNVPAVHPVLSLSASSQSIQSDTQIEINWNISGVEAVAMTSDWVLAIQVPSGWSFVANDLSKTQGSTFDSETGIYTLNAPALTGITGWHTPKEINADQEITARLYYGSDLASETRLIFIFEDDGNRLIGKQGGEASSEGKKFKVKIPANALSEDAYVTIEEPARDGLPAAPVGGNLIEILVKSTVGKEIHQLALDSAPVVMSYEAIPDTNYNPLQAPVPVKEKRYSAEIIVSYDPDDANIEPSALKFYRYDEDAEDWIPLPSIVDTATHTLHAWTDHFSLFSYGEGEADSAVIPPLDSAQVAEFTGSASYSYAIEVPPGHGGATPSISLSYNSQAVEGMFLGTQAGWAGVGWSVNAGGSVIRDRGKDKDSDVDDTYSLILGGSSMQLIPVSTGLDGATPYIDYKAASDNFWRIRRYQKNTAPPDIPEEDWWVAWDKSGTKYVFDQRANFGAMAKINGTRDVVKMRPWGWFLSQTTLANGQMISYTHQSDSTTKCFMNGVDYCGMMAMGMYLRSISYGLGHYQIVFDKESRSDYDYWMRDLNSMALHQIERLKGIRVLVDGQVVREYQLTYFTDSTPIFPASKWEPVQGGGKTGRVSTLKTIKQCGVGGCGVTNNSLPPVTFTYGQVTLNGVVYNAGDFMHLSQVNNGQGGLVTFSYETTTPYYPKVGIANQKVVLGSGRVVPSYPTLMLGTVLVRPGGSYLLNCRFDSDDATAQVRFSIQYLKTGTKAYSVPLSTYSTDYTAREGYVTIPGDAEIANVYVENISGGTYFDTCYAMPMVTQHRVVKKILTDQVTNKSNAFSYQYIDAKVNDPSTSWAAQQPEAERMVVPNSEFRGHAQVNVTGPDGLVTKTFFHQWDSNQGRIYRVDQTDAAGKLLTRTDTTWDRTITETATNVCAKKTSTAPCWKDRRSYWTFMMSQESRQYGSAGEHATIFTGVRRTFIYEAASQGGVQYGNLTHTVESSWNGAAWADYRIQRSRFYPTVSSTVYLTGLPGYENRYSCSGTTNGACYVSGNANLTASNLLTSKWYLYDGSGSATSDDSTIYATLPTQGVLTGERVFLKFGNPANHTDLRYADVAYGYDGWDNLNTTRTYVSDNPASTYAAGSSQTTTMVYDDHVRLVKKTNALGQYETYAYSGIGATCGRPSSILDLNNQTTTLDYDSFCRQKSVVRPGDSTTYPTIQYVYANYASATYPFMAEVVARVTAGNNTNLYKQRNFYNGLGQILQTQTANAAVSGATGNQDLLVDYEYDAYGRLTKQTLPYNVPAWVSGQVYHPANFSDNFSETTYDKLGRPLKKTRPGGAPEAEYSYEIDGSLLKTTTKDATLKLTHQFSDAFGRITKVQPPTGPWLAYQYDFMDNLIGVFEYESGKADPFATTSIGYDQAGRKVSMSDPDMGGWSYTYDALGNLKTQTDARSCIISMTYDALNRITKKTYTGTCSSTAAITYRYDESQYGIGQRTSMLDGSGSTAWAYDARGRMVAEYKYIKSAGLFLTQWEYNSADQATAMIYPGGPNGEAGERVVTSYLPQGSIEKVYSSHTTYVSGTGYDALGRVAQRTRGAATDTPVTSTFNYFPFYDKATKSYHLGLGLLQNLTTKRNNEELQNSEYTYDSLGNIQTIIDKRAGHSNNGQKQAFTYDEVSRLKTAATTGGDGGAYAQETYSYDPQGRLASLPGVGSYTYSSTRVHAVTSTSNGNQYEYDANGNMTKRTIGTDVTNLIYDGNNQLTRLTKETGTVVADFIYDGDGNRVLGTVNGKQTVYIGNYYEVENTTPVSGSGWSAAPYAPFPATSIWRGGSGSAAPESGIYAYALSNQMYGWLLSTPITVSENEQYDIYAYLRGVASTDTSGGGWIVRASFYNSSNPDLILKNVNASSGNSSSLPSAWAQKGGRVTVPAGLGINQMRIVLYHYLSSGWVAFDDVSVYKVTGGVAGGSNLVSDGSFETGGSWTENKSISFPGTSIWRGTYSIAASHTGSYSYVISNLPHVCLQSAAIGVSGNTAYTLKAYVRGAVAAQSITGGWIIRALFYDDTGQYLGYRDAASGGKELTTSWTEKSGTITSLPDAATMRLQLYFYFTSGWVAFDDVSVVTGSGVSLEVADPSFESGEGWTVQASGSFPASSAWRGTWSTGTPHSGTFAYALSNQAWGYLASKAIPVMAGQPYDLYASVRGSQNSEEGTAWWILRAMFYDASGGYLSYQDAASGNTSPITTSWQRLGKRLTAPAGAASVQIYLRNDMTTGWVAYDNISLYNVTGGVAVLPNLVADPGFENSTYTTTTFRQYYYAGGERLAVREGSGTGGTGLTWLLGDHLGSTSVTFGVDTGARGEQRYKPWGALRYSTGSTPTSFQYTGQRAEVDLGLDFYGARWYDPALGCFISPDTYVPNPFNPLDWDRYAYTRNNPVNYTDPTGHAVACVNDDFSTGCAGNGMGDLTPSQIVATDAPQEIQDRAIYNYTLTHPDYNYVLDNGLDDIGKFIVSNGIFRGNADSIYRQLNIWDRIDSSWPLIGNGLSLSIAVVIANGGGENRHTSRGREAHRNYENALPGTYDFNKKVPKTNIRPDAIDWTSNTVRELKPDNPRAVARGLKQLSWYVKELQRVTQQTWQGFLDTYKK